MTALASCAGRRGSTTIPTTWLPRVATTARPATAIALWVFGSYVRVVPLVGSSAFPSILFFFYPLSSVTLYPLFPARSAAEKFSLSAEPPRAADAGRGTAGGGARVLRGASWINNDPDNMVASNRNDNEADNHNQNVGFRVVCAGGSAGRCSETGEVPGGEQPCPASAKKLPNLLLPALEKPGKIRSGGPWPVTAVQPDGVRESHGPLPAAGARPSGRSNARPDTAVTPTAFHRSPLLRHECRAPMRPRGARRP